MTESAIRAATTRSWLPGGDLEMSDAARQRVAAGYHMIDSTDAEA